jgi:hypothetical protein
MLHLREHGEGNFGRQIHENQVWGALRELFHEAGHQAACGQELETVDLPENQLEAFSQNGFIAIKKNPRHILYLYEQPIQILFCMNRMTVFYSIVGLFTSDVKDKLSPLQSKSPILTAINRHFQRPVASGEFGIYTLLSMIYEVATDVLKRLAGTLKNSR